MQRAFSKIAIAGAALVVIAGLTMVIRGDVTLRQRTGFPQDWSHSHLIFANPGSFAQAVRNGSVAHWYKIMNDPRYQVQQLRRNAAAMQRNLAVLKPTPAKSTPPKPAPPKSATVHRDWNFSLDATSQFGGVATPKLPAKYSFNETGASCANDFVIYGLNTTGGATQANLVGVNNLYVAGTGGGGCGSITNNGGAGSNPTPQVKWAFNVGAASVTTGVVLSLDGTQVAYVLQNLGGTPVLQVLTLGTGTVGKTCGSAVCSVDNPATPGNSTEAPGSSLASVSLSSSTSDSNSSLFVDYATNTGYVGDDSGNLYKVQNVFGGTAPSIVGGWPVSAGSTYLNSPIFDGATSRVFVGSYNGNLYGFTSSGSAISGSPLTLSTSGGQTFGLYYASPIVDSTNHVLYEFMGASAGSVPVVAQVVFTSTPTLSSSTTSSLSTAGTNLVALQTTPAGLVMTDGAFSNGYFSSGPTGASSFLYACGAGQATSPYAGVTLQQFSFNGSGILSSSATVDTITADTAYTYPTPGPYFMCSPATEFYNTNGTPVDYLFLSVPVANEIVSFNITSETKGTAITPAATFPSVPFGASGIIVDGADPTSNASSLYFSSQTEGTCTTNGGAGSAASPANTGIGSGSPAICAYKLTQSGLN